MPHSRLHRYDRNVVLFLFALAGHFAPRHMSGTGRREMSRHMARAHFDPRKRLAAGGLLLASFLEVCGCNPVRDCCQVRTAAMPWSAVEVIEECHGCVASSELATREEDRNASTNAHYSDASDRSRNVAEALNVGADLLFYKPASSPSEAQPSDAKPVTASLLLDTKPIQWPIPESVYFLYRSDLADAGRAHHEPIATAFVVSVPSPRHRTSIRFLVTARHIVDPQWAHCQEPNPSTIQIRLNKRTGGVGYETIHLGQIFIPEDGASDLAMIPLDRKLIPSLDDYKFIDVPYSMLPTDAELKAIKADQQIMTAGLRTGPPIEAGNYPVFNPGVLTGPVDEAVEIRCTTQLDPRPLRIWLISADIPQGVSGAPVYTEMGRGTDSFSTPVLLGVQSVSWPERSIAAITPSVVLDRMIQAVVKEEEAGVHLSAGSSR